MADNAQDIVAVHCRAEGVTPPAPREDGSFALSFEGKYAVTVSDLEGGQVLLRCDLPPLKQDVDRQDVLHRLLQANLVLAGRKRSTLSLDRATGIPFLYCVLSTAAEREDARRRMTAFVNEVAAIRRALDRGH